MLNHHKENFVIMQDFFEFVLVNSGKNKVRLIF